MHDIISEADIAYLIDAFYKKVVADPVIGYLFTDVVALSWEEHIPIMNDFWGSILLGTGKYRRDPLSKHISLDKKEPLVPEHFDRWLELWEATIGEHFTGAKADQALARAKHIAAVMQHQIAKAHDPNPADHFRFTEQAAGPGV